MKNTVMSNTLLVVISLFVSQPAVAENPLPLDCQPKFAGAQIIHGTNGDDRFFLQFQTRLYHQFDGRTFLYRLNPDKNYIINTGPGNDEVDYIGSNSKYVQICTGSGEDDVEFSSSTDETTFWIYTGTHNDRVLGWKTGESHFIYGGSGNDHLRSIGENKISISGESGSDCISTDNHNASLNGLGGNDYIIAELSTPPQASTLNGSGGFDTCIFPVNSSPDLRLYSCEATSNHQESCEYYGWNP